MMVRRVLVVAALVAAAISTAPSTTPAIAEDCTDGVIVVVDASALGAGISERCVPGAPATGLEALTAAGHDYTFVPRQPGLVCTIDARPDPCNGAPTDAYWSYWHAAQGGTWQYSNRGAGNRSPQRGTVEGWRFGSGSPPGIAPPDGSPEPEPEPEPEPDEEPDEESSSGSGGSGRSGGSGGSGGSSGSGGSGGSGGSDGSDGLGSSGSGSAPSGSAESASSDANASEDAPTEGPGEEPGEPPASRRSIEPAEPAEEVLVDAPADTDPVEGEDSEPTDLDTPPTDDDTATPPADDGTLALPDGDEDGMPIGLVAGGGLVAGLAGMTVLQVRRRRLED